MTCAGQNNAAQSIALMVLCVYSVLTAASARLEVYPPDGQELGHKH